MKVSQGLAAAAAADQKSWAAWACPWAWTLDRRPLEVDWVLVTWVGTVLEACNVGREGLPSWACCRGRTLGRTWLGGTWAVEGCPRP